MIAPRAVFAGVFVAVAGLVFGVWAALAALVLVAGPLWWLGRSGRPARQRRGRTRRVWTDDERRFILERDGWQCVWCGSTDELEIDHVIPFSRGGACSVDNAQVLCGPHNREKGAT